MNDFKIYREGHYDHKAMIALKIRSKLPAVIGAIDNFFENH